VEWLKRFLRNRKDKILNDYKIGFVKLAIKKKGAVSMRLRSCKQDVGLWGLS